ncbi:YggT family protein [soil metagenome]
MGVAIIWLVNTVINLMVLALILSAILSWLFAFDVINHRNRFVNQLAAFLDAVTQPLLAPIRRVVPNLGGVDLSFIVLLLLLKFVQILFNNMAAPVLVQLLG